MAALPVRVKMAILPNKMTSLPIEMALLPVKSTTFPVKMATHLLLIKVFPSNMAAHVISTHLPHHDFGPAISGKTDMFLFVILRAMWAILCIVGFGRFRDC
jgi:hypothetical protein